MSGAALGPRRGAALAALATVALAALATIGPGCGGGEERTVTAPAADEDIERIVVRSPSGDFDPAGIYGRAAPGVVTVISVFGETPSILGGGAGQGSGFVVSDEGEIVTNAHVVTTGGAVTGGGGELEPAESVFVEFANRDRVEAEIVGFDADSDLALIEVDPDGLELEPLRLSGRDRFAVGEPVAAIGSPFGEDQSLSLGVVSATDRSIQSLTEFRIDSAIQTDASINPGNSGGPLLDGDGEVIGVNQQIETASGSNSGVGFAIPVATVHYALEQLREDGDVEYAYIGVSTQSLWPQLAEELGIDSDGGALISEVIGDGPADDAGLEGGSREISFQGSRITVGGDVIVAVDGHQLVRESDLSELISQRRPGETVTLIIIRDGDQRELEVELEARPD